MKNILGLDLGPNSIGWAVIDGEGHRILGAGSRIIPMDGAEMAAFESGNLQSKASVRTGYRGTRRLYERSTLRRERLLRVLHVLGFLPAEFESQIDFERHPGQFKEGKEPLLPYQKDAAGKNRFIFEESFQEMLRDFVKHQPSLVAEGKKIPHDWTIYYLRDKALNRAISREELAWILLNFNTKRGYYEREEDDGKADNKREEYKVLTIINVEAEDANKKKPGHTWYKVTFEDGTYRKVSSPSTPYKIGDKVESIVTTTLTSDGQTKYNKEGEPMISFRLPKDDDWNLMKTRTEHEIEQSKETVGSFIYHHLLSNPDAKIKGKLVRVIERKYYRRELRQILECQKKFIPELSDKMLYDVCVGELYPNNEEHVNSMPKCDFTYLFDNDILFYHRPLKSKKSLIDDCPFERRSRVDGDSGEVVQVPVKCMSKSHPLFQEFRTWQFIHDLKILKREGEAGGKTVFDQNVTEEFIPTLEAKQQLWTALSEKKEITQKQMLALFRHNNKPLSEKEYRWNYVEDKTYPLNPFRYEVRRRLDKVLPATELTAEQDDQLWHLLYSINNNDELRKGLYSWARRNASAWIAEADQETLRDLANRFADAFARFPKFASDYASYSRKAIAKLLPLMRDRGLTKTEACQQVYGKTHNTDERTFSTTEELAWFTRYELRKEGLRNPVVESVLGETLRVVHDIWKEYGRPDEIHVEMGRDLKQTNDQRAGTTQRILDNERANLRIKALLQEFVKPEYKIDGVKAYSPVQQDILKIYEENVLSNEASSLPEDIASIVKDLGSATGHVSSQQMKRYKLWLDQKYKSPYTGQPIPLSRLFTADYEIEHVIPRSRFFDDSFNNKVICESEVNKLKDQMLGYEFIRQCHGQIVYCHGLGREVPVLDEKQYEDFVKLHYKGNSKKMKQLLMDEIPTSFTQRQLNDTKYLARKTMEILSGVVRDKDDEGALSSNLVSLNGNITTRLKTDWGLNDVWNTLVAPRFERMNRLTDSTDYGHWVAGNNQHFQTSVPLALSYNFQKKRIDHRHHAMDAIVIAACSRSIVNYLNNSHAHDEKSVRQDLQRLLCEKKATDSAGNYKWTLKKPWETFTQEAADVLAHIIVSFKQNLRIATPSTNRYYRWENGRKVLVEQTGGDHLSVRKPLHKQTVFGRVRMRQYGKVNVSEALSRLPDVKDRCLRDALRELLAAHNGDVKAALKDIKARDYQLLGRDCKKVEITWIPKLNESTDYAVRVSVSDLKSEADIDKVTDTGIRTILRNHLSRYTGSKNPFEDAFSPEGITEMNRNIQTLNGGKPHKPIYKVRKIEHSDAKFPIGETGNKTTKFVEAESGTNLYFAIYENADGKRSFETIPLNVALERVKQHTPIAPEVDAEGNRLLFTLSPGDLVFKPTEDDENLRPEDIRDARQVLKFVSSGGTMAMFLPATSASPIANKVEFSSQNKSEKPWHSVPIKTDVNPNHRSEDLPEEWFTTAVKATCLKIEVDRLGRVKKIYQ